MARSLLGYLLLLATLAFPVRPAIPQPVSPLGGTMLLTATNELSAAMMDGLHRFAENRIERSVTNRQRFWALNFSSKEAYEVSIRPNRDRFRKAIGLADSRAVPHLEYFADAGPSALVSENLRCRIYRVRWAVLDGVSAEGLLIEPRTPRIGWVIAVPDADQTPEEMAGLVSGDKSGSVPIHLAEAGFAVLVPALISRSNDWSGNAKVFFTNQPHREWIYRQAYHMGRHIIGYEVQKILAAIDWIKQRHPNEKIGVAGSGEGGLLAFYAAAVEPRIDAALVSGYFTSRQKIWKEPIYRNVFGLLREFGDAEIARLIAPRSLVVEYSAGPVVEGPPPVRPGRRGGAAVGELSTPPFETVRDEFLRLKGMVPDGFQRRVLVHGKNGEAVEVGSGEALQHFASFFGGILDPSVKRARVNGAVAELQPPRRQERQVKELENHVQDLLRNADHVRDAFFLGTTSLRTNQASRGQRFRQYRVPEQPLEPFLEEIEPFRAYFEQEILGRLDEPFLSLTPRTRQIYDREKWNGYEVILDVVPDVFAWGVLLVPKNLKPGERRPVVVCQHGRSGLPREVIEGDNFYYHDFAARLADEGFITFAPHNPYRGEDLYRVLNRKANATKLTLFSFILAQHTQILRWLKGLPFVDPARIAFYGLSYGGETAVRIPPILSDYCLSICSGDFNDWARKVVSTESDYSFMFTVEWEMPYFNMGSTFNYAEAACLMIPRPFMVERGHHDGVAPDEWVASEYAKVRWVYTQLGLKDKTEIEFYNGGHTINGEGTFQFLRKHLKWPGIQSR